MAQAWPPLNVCKEKQARKEKRNRVLIQKSKIRQKEEKWKIFSK